MHIFSLNRAHPTLRVERHTRQSAHFGKVHFKEHLTWTTYRTIKTYGAGDGNRTHVFWLGTRFSTIEIHPLT